MQLLIFNVKIVSVIILQIEIHKGSVDLSGEPILSDINLTINTNSRIGLVGRNGCGKTTLLRLLGGELKLSNVEGDGGFMAISGNPVIGTLNQMAFADDSVTLVDEIKSAYKDILDAKNAFNIDGVYDDDPAINPNAKKYDSVSIQQVVDERLQVVDLTATIMCMENKMPMVVFGLNEENSIVKTLYGEFTGTYVTV